MNPEERIFILEQAFISVCKGYHDFIKLTFESIKLDKHQIDDWTACKDIPCINHAKFINELNEGVKN